MSRTGTVCRGATSRRVAVAVVGVLSVLLAVALLWPDGRMVNRASGPLEGQLRERHDAGDFATKTQDKIAASG